jgi:hypothetical protein
MPTLKLTPTDLHLIPDMPGSTCMSALQKHTPPRVRQECTETTRSGPKAARKHAH